MSYKDRDVYVMLLVAFVGFCCTLLFICGLENTTTIKTNAPIKNRETTMFEEMMSPAPRHIWKPWNINNPVHWSDD